MDKVFQTVARSRAGAVKTRPRAHKGPDAFEMPLKSLNVANQILIFLHCIFHSSICCYFQQMNVQQILNLTILSKKLLISANFDKENPANVKSFDPSNFFLIYGFVFFKINGLEARV